MKEKRKNSQKIKEKGKEIKWNKKRKKKKDQEKKRR